MVMYGSTESESEEETNLRKSQSYDKVTNKNRRQKSYNSIKKSKSYNHVNMEYYVNKVSDDFEEHQTKIDQLTDSFHLLHDHVYNMSQAFLDDKEKDKKRFKKFKNKQKLLEEKDPAHEIEELRDSLASCKKEVKKGKKRFTISTALEAGFVCLWGVSSYLKRDKNETKKRDKNETKKGDKNETKRRNKRVLKTEDTTT